VLAAFDLANGAEDEAEGKTVFMAVPKFADPQPCYFLDAAVLSHLK
jgi:hypothetical protein